MAVSTADNLQEILVVNRTITLCVHRELNEIGSGGDRGRYQAPEPISSEIVSLTQVDWSIVAIEKQQTTQPRWKI